MSIKTKLLTFHRLWGHTIIIAIAIAIVSGWQRGLAFAWAVIFLDSILRTTATDRSIENQNRGEPMTTFFFAAAVAALLVAAGASITRVQHILADMAKHIEQQEVSG